ncbi:histidine kinase [Thioclava sp. NG1]|uniref:PAS domain S-box protein n=1 Tax=Thioclava sp. NG1 TaxID=2182426 RepID=UPI000D613D37|nr:PAS domain S-box protein [Thioclava sp. NG1]PWE48078.1 histidine kinase [Thioclava sp. NG1]
METPEAVQQHLAAIVEGSDDAIVTKDINSIILSWNRGAEDLFGYTAEEAIGRPITIIFPQDRIEEEVNFIARLRRGERIAHFETIRQRKDGRLVPVSLTISPVHQLAEQQRLLLSEMRHRVGNAFAIAASLISVAARQAESVRQLSSEMRCRLNAIAVLNSRTAQSPESEEPAGVPLSELAFEITRPFGEGMNIQFSLPDIQVKPTAITPLTLVLFELATNSVKYGGLSSGGHGVEIAGTIEEGRLKLRWQEARISSNDSTRREGFGTKLCEHTVSASLGGSFSRVFEDNDLIANLDLNLSKVA